jgi:hypothetical protein
VFDAGFARGALSRNQACSGAIVGFRTKVGCPFVFLWSVKATYPGKYSPHAKKEIAAARPALFITGHSHILRVMRDPAANLLHMNSGACGHHGWHRMRTILRFTIEDSKIFGVEAIELGSRGAKNGIA